MKAQQARRATQGEGAHMVRFARMAATILLGVAAVAMATGGGLDAATLARGPACRALDLPPTQRCRVLASDARGAVARTALRGGSREALAEAETALRVAADACAAADAWPEAAQLTHEAADIAGVRAQRGDVGTLAASAGTCAAEAQGVLFDAFAATRRRVALLASAPAQLCPVSLGGGGARTLKAAVQSARHAECAWLMDAAARRGAAGADALEAHDTAPAMLALSAALNALNTARPACASAPRRRVDAARETLADVITALRDAAAPIADHAARVRAVLPPRPSPLRMDALAASLERSALATCGAAPAPSPALAPALRPASELGRSAPAAPEAAGLSPPEARLRGPARPPTLRR